MRCCRAQAIGWSRATSPARMRSSCVPTWPRVLPKYPTTGARSTCPPSTSPTRPSAIRRACAPFEACWIDMTDDDFPRRRSVRSFVVRAGRMGTGQMRALEELGPRYVLPYSPQATDWPVVFGRDAPRVLEIGFGMGQATAAIAQAMPGTDFIGVEVHTPGVG